MVQTFLREHHQSQIKTSKSAIVIGAGITGLDIAWRLCQAGFQVTVLERQKLAGGLAATIPYGEYRIDIGPHVIELSRQSSILEEIKKVMGDELIEIKYPSKHVSHLVYFRGRLLERYPTLYEVLFNFGAKFFIRSAFDYFAFKFKSVRKNQFETAENYLISSYGKYLYENWIKPLAIRMYGDPKEWQLELMVKTFPPLTVKRILSFLFRSPSRRKDLLVSTNEICYWYFKNGMGSLTDKLLSLIEKIQWEDYTWSRSSKHRS